MQQFVFQLKTAKSFLIPCRETRRREHRIVLTHRTVACRCGSRSGRTGPGFQLGYGHAHAFDIDVDVDFRSEPS